MPEFLTRKLGPLPVWGYAAIGIGLFFVMRMRQAKAASTSPTGPSASYTATTPNVPTESVSTPSGFSYSGPAGGGQYYIPQGAMAQTSGGVFSAPSNQSRIGGGYGSSGAGANFVTSASGQQFAQVPVGNAITGQQYYYQPEPGVFTQLPMNAGGGTPPAPGGPSTPWFQLVSGSA